MFARLIVTPYMQRSGPFGLIRWGVDAMYEDVTEEWIGRLHELWMGCEAVPIQFLYRGMWCTGRGYIVSSNISAGHTIDVDIHITGTGKLKRGRINGTTL